MPGRMGTLRIDRAIYLRTAEKREEGQDQITQIDRSQEMSRLCLQRGKKGPGTLETSSFPDLGVILWTEYITNRSLLPAHNRRWQILDSIRMGSLQRPRSGG